MVIIVINILIIISGLQLKPRRSRREAAMIAIESLAEIICKLVSGTFVLHDMLLLDLIPVNFMA